MLGGKSDTSKLRTSDCDIKADPEKARAIDKVVSNVKYDGRHSVSFDETHPALGLGGLFDYQPLSSYEKAIIRPEGKLTHFDYAVIFLKGTANLTPHERFTLVMLADMYDNDATGWDDVRDALTSTETFKSMENLVEFLRCSRINAESRANIGGRLFTCAAVADAVPHIAALAWKLTRHPSERKFDAFMQNKWAAQLALSANMAKVHASRHYEKGNGWESEYNARAGACYPLLLDNMKVFMPEKVGGATPSGYSEHDVREWLTLPIGRDTDDPEIARGHLLKK